MKNLIYLLQNENFCLIFGIITSYLLVILYFNNWKFSNITDIRIIQKTLLISIILIIIFCILSIFFEFLNFSLLNTIENQSDFPDVSNNLNTLDNKTKDLNVSGNLTGVLNMNKDAAKEIGTAIKTGASNIGLGAAIGGTATAVAKVASGTPLQKIITVGIGAGLGGIMHIAASSANKSISESILNNNLQNSDGNTPPSPISPSSIFEESIFENLLSNNPVESLLTAIFIINIISFFLIILLIISLISKNIYNKEYELKWVDKIISNNYSIKIKNIIKILLKLLNKSSSINIWLIILLLFISICASIYFLNIFILNFESFCKLYLKYINK